VKVILEPPLALLAHDSLNWSRRTGALVLRLRLPYLVGSTCFAITLFMHQSEHHHVFGRWSYAAFAGVVGAGLLWCLVAWSSLRIYRASETAFPARSSATVLVGLAVLFWGVGYLWAALDDANSAANVFDLDLFGSVTPATIVLSWLALAALWLAGVAWLTHRRSAHWTNVGLTCATLGLIAVAGEGVVRAKAILAPATQGFPTYQSALWTRRFVRLNRMGFRDSTHAVARIAGIKRLLLIGDSFAFGVGIRRTEDRLGEQLVTALDRETGLLWEVINASHPDLHTLNELAMLDSMIAYRPDIVLLEYVFNDIDYLRPVTPRSALTEAPQGLAQRLHPLRVLFWNFFLAQEVYVRARALYWSLGQAPLRDDPYDNAGLLRIHLQDLTHFVAQAQNGGAFAGIVPVDVNVVGSVVARRRYESFVRQALAVGLPVWRVDSAFSGLKLRQLAVNRLDHHPNELANRLIARETWPKVVNALWQLDRRAGPERHE
jgi:hypothetical protein